MEENKNTLRGGEIVTGHKKRHSVLIISMAILIGVLLCATGYMLGNGSSFKGLLLGAKNSIENSAKNGTEVVETSATSSLLQTPEERIGLTPDSEYSVKFDAVYYRDQYVEDLDFETAVYVGAGYIKDSRRVFQNGEPLPGANPETCTKETLERCAESVEWETRYTPYALDVAWNDEQVSDEGAIPAGSCKSEGYVVGKVENGPLAGGRVLVQNDDICGMWCSASAPPVNATHYVQFDDYLIPVNTETGFTFSDSKVKLVKNSFDGSYGEDPVIDIPSSGYWLAGGNTIGFNPDREADDLTYLFTDSAAGPIYRSKSDCFLSERPDHVQLSYRLDFDYIDRSTGVFDIKMLDGTKNTEAYQFIPSYHSCYDLVEQDWLKPNERLVKSGEFPNGDDVYRLANAQDEHLVAKYEDKNTLASFNGGENKYSYSEYLSFNPFLYWQDPFGGWVQFMNRRFESAAEKCKPVVYLYPKETGDFSVYVKPNGGFTKTIPDYGAGWQVTATPDSKITDKKTGETYPYLYWAGINIGVPEITEGWLVERANTEAFLVEKLTTLGLSEQEISDFNEYWIPRFEDEGADQYKIMFLPQQVFEPMAPLTVVGDETPDSIIRVMMYAQPAHDGDVLPEQILPPTPVRTGFTVVEWGGAMFN